MPLISPLMPVPLELRIYLTDSILMLIQIDPVAGLMCVTVLICTCCICCVDSDVLVAMQDSEAGLVLQQCQIHNKGHKNCFKGSSYRIKFSIFIYIETSEMVWHVDLIVTKDTWSAKQPSFGYNRKLQESPSLNGNDEMLLMTSLSRNCHNGAINSNILKQTSCVGGRHNMPPPL